jgi:hypothetical protein
LTGEGSLNLHSERQCEPATTFELLLLELPQMTKGLNPDVLNPPKDPSALTIVLDTLLNSTTGRQWSNLLLHLARNEQNRKVWIEWDFGKSGYQGFLGPLKSVNIVGNNATKASFLA